ncbi:MAG: hypothetical protein LBL44_08085 [Treponema sp.]|jgi:hypothetical protein|nr:hypothetical protein [Treponema sp.]
MKNTVYDKRRLGNTSRAPAFTFFNLKISLKTACIEENIHRKVEEVEKGREKGDLRAKTYLTFSHLIDRAAVFFAVKNSSKTWWFPGT